MGRSRVATVFVSTMLATHTHAQTTAMDFSPDNYLSGKYASSPAAPLDGVSVSEIDIGGRMYTTYQHASGTLFVEKLTRPDADPRVFLECESMLDNSRVRQEQRITFEKPIAPAVSVDLSLVTEAIVSRCSGQIHGISPSRDPLEFGVRIKNKDGSSYRIFNRMLKPNIGFQTEF
jgi:hypothetical protein